MFHNNYKKWSDNDIIILDNYIRTNIVITNNDIVNIANILKRTTNAIIFRIFNTYIFEEYDFLYNNNRYLYNKYKFFNENDIDDFLIKDFSKKQKKNFKLNKINSIVLNLIIDDNKNCMNKYNDIIDTIKYIYKIDN